jgi:hypothetical protein
MAGKKRPTPPSTSQSPRPAHPSALQRAKVSTLGPPAVPMAVARVKPEAIAPKRARRAALRALVPSAVRAEGEADPFLHAYKSKWLSRLDFASGESTESLLLLSFMVLALGRSAESEAVANNLIRYVDVRRGDERTRDAAVCALRLAAWLKARRGIDASILLARASQLGRGGRVHDREWLSSEAEQEIRDARARQKLGYFLFPLCGIVRFLNDGAARPKAEALLAIALHELRAVMEQLSPRPA